MAHTHLPSDYVAATPWSKGSKRVLMSEQAWFVYHAAWLVTFRPNSTYYAPDPIDVANLQRARDIVFG